MSTEYVTTETLEIALEEVDKHYLRAALSVAFNGAYGEGTFHFVGRPSGTSPVVRGEPFAMMRSRADEDTGEPNDWGDALKSHLHDFDETLRHQGWTLAPTRGPHWWSLRYTKG